ARTWRLFEPPVITNQPVMARTSPTSSTTVASSVFAAAARAASTTHRRVVSSASAILVSQRARFGHRRRIDADGGHVVLTEHHGQIGCGVGLLAAHDLTDAEGVTEVLGGTGLGVLVVDELRGGLPERPGVAHDVDLGAGCRQHDG